MEYHIGGVSHTGLSRKLKSSLPWVGLPIILLADEEDSSDSSRFCMNKMMICDAEVICQKWNSGHGKNIAMVPKQHQAL